MIKPGSGGGPIICSVPPPAGMQLDRNLLIDVMNEPITIDNTAYPQKPDLKTLQIPRLQ
ncbi:MAG: hypothetical protein JW779_05710 [Candidatus Thorarchaeota archaeon]|nr:hypothetical protein [Candidatus Thorarchaeota archaeon]